MESTFWSKLTIYAFKENKCVYADENLGETPTDNWIAINWAIKESKQGYNFEVFKEMLQNRLLPKTQ